jgi:hypothetical protein
MHDVFGKPEGKSMEDRVVLSVGMGKSIDDVDDY